MTKELRICFFGDSFTQGVGDPEHRGWVGRVLEQTDRDVIGFNLGIRRDTSADVLRRCWSEAEVRMLPGADNRLVVSFGSNDMIEEGDGLRVDPARTLDNLDALLDDAARRTVSILFVGPPPVVDAGGDHLSRTLALAEQMSAACHARGVPFVHTTRTLAADPTWSREALAGDGAHPGRGGYQRMAEVILASSWRAWLGTAAHDPK